MRPVRVDEVRKSPRRKTQNQTFIEDDYRNIPNSTTSSFPWACLEPAGPDHYGAIGLSIDRVLSLNGGEA